MSTADRVTNSEPVAEGAKQPTFASTVFGAICAFGLGGWVFYSLWGLENGSTESTRVWVPIAMLYESLGFWPAIALLPAMGLFLTYKATSMFLSSQGHDSDAGQRG